MNSNNTVFKRGGSYNNSNNDGIFYFNNNGNANSNVPERKYYDLYLNTLENESIRGDALYEIKGWNRDESCFVNSSLPVYVRGGHNNDTLNNGVFRFVYGNGLPSGYFGFRVCLVIE